MQKCKQACAFIWYFRVDKNLCGKWKCVGTVGPRTERPQAERTS